MPLLLNYHFGTRILLLHDPLLKAANSWCMAAFRTTCMSVAAAGALWMRLEACSNTHHFGSCQTLTAKADPPCSCGMSAVCGMV